MMDYGFASIGHVSFGGRARAIKRDFWGEVNICGSDYAGRPKNGHATSHSHHGRLARVVDFGVGRD